MNKIRIIDLLNKIANGEEVPKCIKIRDEYWYWNDFDGYVTKNSLNTTPDAQYYLHSKYIISFMLNEEVEVLEDTPNKIEKLLIETDSSNMKFYKYKNNGTTESGYSRNYSLSDIEMIEKINEIIEHLNQKGE